MSFADALKAAPGAAELMTRGIVSPTPVQDAVWEPFLQRRDLLVQSGTGTGKTLAYLLPLLEEIDPSKKDLQALILVPTQELALQILKQMELLTGGAGLRAVALIGGVNLSRQVDQLKTKPQWAVGTPGRVLELLEKKKITGHFHSTIVLDEADRLLDSAGLVVLRPIFKTTLKSRRTALFSASLPASAELASREFVRDAEVLRVDAARPIPALIEHWSFQSAHREKIDVVRKILGALAPERALIFLNRPEQIEMVAEKLRFHGVSAESLHGSLFKVDRQKALQGFSHGKVKVLVASDLAARGLDLPDVTLVVQFDVPVEALDFQHRCGRTGRAGKVGLNICLADEVEQQRLDSVAKRFEVEIQGKVFRQGRIMDHR